MKSNYKNNNRVANNSINYGNLQSSHVYSNPIKSTSQSNAVTKESVEFEEFEEYKQGIPYNSNLGYINNTQNNYEQIIQGYFPKENLVKAMAIKKVNKTLCGLLLCLIFVSIISYYFVVSSEIKLNDYSRQTIMLNDENSDLQNKLDKLKSFNNVDMTMQKNNLLQKPDQVIEAPEVQTPVNKTTTFETEHPFSWSIGY